MIKNLLLLIFPLLLFSQNTMFNADSAYSNIEYLSETIGPRPMGSINENEALHWAQSKFRSFAADTAYIIEFSRATVMGTTYITQSGIAVGIFKGEVDTAIVVGGHIDSDDFEIPGANDNASGTATVVELARIWSDRPRHYTMVFCTFGGEEKGLLGSQYFVENYRHIDKVALMISTDMAASAGKIEILFEQKDKQAPQWLVRDAFAISRQAELDHLTYTTHFHALVTLSEGGPGSDHIPFLGHGIPAIDFTTGVGTSPIHTPQDNMRFIDKDVLQKYGTFVDELLSYYHKKGIPQDTDDRYVFWDLYGLQLFIPYWSIIGFNILSIILGFSAFYYAMRKRKPYEENERIRFSGIKLLFLLSLVVIFSHLGEALIQLVKGFRYPWVGQINSYILLTFLWIIFGFWVVLRLSRNWKFSQDPASYAIRTIIILAVFLIPSFFLSARLALYPALALFLFGLAVFVKNPDAKAVLAAITILPIYRIFFNEEFIFLMQMGTATGIRIDTIFKSLLFNTIITLTLVLISLPLIYSYTYVVFSNDRFKSLLTFFQKPITVIIILTFIISLSVYLIVQPAYSEKYRPFIRVNAEYQLPEKSSKLTISGNEYFKDVEVTTDSLNQFVEGRIHKTDISLKYEANWLEVQGSTIAQQGLMDTVEFSYEIHSTRPWIQATLEFWPDTADIVNPESDLPYFLDRNRIKFYWYGHYRDTLGVNGKFVIEHGAKIIRKVTAKYLEMPVSINITSQLANIEYRTAIQYQDTLYFR